MVSITPKLNDGYFGRINMIYIAFQKYAKKCIKMNIICIRDADNFQIYVKEQYSCYFDAGRLKEN